MNTVYIKQKNTVYIKQNECLRCDHKWFQRKPKKPIICPKCKSPYWDTPRERKKIKHQ